MEIKDVGVVEKRGKDWDGKNLRISWKLIS